MNVQQLYRNQPLNNDQLMRFAPSVFATKPWQAMSARYSFIPTIQVIEKMRTEGFLPYSAQQSTTRIPGKADFTKHLVRFRDVRQGTGPAIQSLGQIFPELVLINSHDGLSSYQLQAGFFRLICLNGMICADGSFSPINVRHSGDVSDVIEASYEVVEQFPRVLASVESFQQKLLSAGQAEAYGAAALTLRYDEDEAPVTPRDIIRPRRSEDQPSTLWNVFNRVQENLTQGQKGLHGWTETGRRIRKTRAVKSISEDTRINKALWTLTEKMRDLVA